MYDDKLKPHADPEMRKFEEALMRSVTQAMSGEHARVTTPEQIVARRKGRPVGTVKADSKVQTAIRFDQDVLAALKATGAGWQTRVNDTMRDWLRSRSAV